MSARRPLRLKMMVSGVGFLRRALAEAEPRLRRAVQDAEAQAACVHLFQRGPGGTRCRHCGAVPTHATTRPRSRRASDAPARRPLPASAPGRVDVWLPIFPPSTTAQMKGVRIVDDKPIFFRRKKLARHVREWEDALRPHVPSRPVAGPIAMEIALDYPHTQDSRRRGPRVPKVSRPDVDGAVKQLIDTCQQLGFFVDDAHVYELTVTKWHSEKVGIRLRIETATPRSL